MTGRNKATVLEDRRDSEVSDGYLSQVARLSLPCGWTQAEDTL